MVDFMKIRTWIKYEESYLPPRCRKLRYKRCEDYINANLTEISMDNVKLAFEDNSYSGKGKIYYFKNKLWSMVEKSHLIAGDTEKYKDALEILKLGSSMTNLSIQHNFTAEQIAGLAALALECRNYTVVMDRIPYDGLYTSNGENLDPVWPETIEKLHATIY